MNGRQRAAEERAAKRKEEIVEVLTSFWEEHGYGPTRTDIARALGIRQETVSKYVTILLEEKVLTEVPGISRTLRLWG